MLQKQDEIWKESIWKERKLLLTEALNYIKTNYNKIFRSLLKRKIDEILKCSISAILNYNKYLVTLSSDYLFLFISPCTTNFQYGLRFRHSNCKRKSCRGYWTKNEGNIGKNSKSFFQDPSVHCGVISFGQCNPNNSSKLATLLSF